MLDYEGISWDDIKKNGTKVIMVDTEQPMSIKILDSDEQDRRELLSVNTYVSHSSNDYGSEGMVNIYEIQDRAIDTKGNLILFVKNKLVRYSR